MSDEEQTQTVEPPRALILALRAILRPLVALLIKKQIHHPFLSNLLKSIYIEVAEDDFKLGKKDVTLSRLSVLTGIHRREAKRIRAHTAAPNGPPASITLGAQIIARWISETPWINSEGRPRALPRESKDAGVDTFHTLVRSVSVDIHPRSILDEWLRLGVAEMDDDDIVSLKSAAFVPAKGYDEKAHYVGRNVRDHMSAAFENLESAEPPFLERSTYYGSLPVEEIPALEAFARETAQDALLKVNERALAVKNQAAPGGTRRRINFGVYFFEDDADKRDGDDPETEDD